MALNETFFESADQGYTNVYKFRFEGDPNHYVWFEYGPGGGSLHQTTAGPYRVDDPIDDAGFADLDALLAARDTSKDQWVKDLMAQFGEALEWTYPSR